MSETADQLPPVRPRRRWRRLLLLLVPVALVAAAWMVLPYFSDRRLARVLAETDQLDPHWRLDDILAERAVLSDGENSALTVLAARGKRPARWPLWDLQIPGTSQEVLDLAETLQNLKPNQSLTAAELALMAPEMKNAAEAIQIARQLIDQPRGRYAITYTKDYIGTLLRGIQEAREVAAMLQYDARFRAQSGDFDGAIVSCRALVNAARSIGDEPMLIAQLVRMAMRTIAVGETERTLGQGEPTVAELAGLQSIFEEEQAVPLYQIGIRGERGGMDQFMDTLGKGGMSIKQVRGLLGPPGFMQQNNRWTGEEALLYLPGAISNNRAALLDHLNRMVEASKLPPEQQAAAAEEVNASLKKEPLLVRMLVPGTEKVAEAERRTTALLRCAAAGLAAERYRRDHGHWPKTLEELKGKYLSEVPIDPYDGKPLRLRSDDDGIIIYALGKDRKDDGGDRATLNTYKDGTDVGFRLWDVSKRHQPRK
jgi:hypothetical protein